MAFSKKEYDQNYKKKHKKIFAVELNIEEYNEMYKLLDKLNIQKVKFVRDAFENLKNKTIKKGEDKNEKNSN